MDPLLTYAERQRGRLFATLEELVRAESPSTDKAAVDRCGAVLARLLEAAGAEVERLPQADRGDHLRATFEGTGPRVLVLGHVDTVWPVGQIERMPFREESGRLHGPGIYDMKGGLACALLAIQGLRALALPLPRVVVLFTADEEIGSASSRAVIEAEARKSACVLVLEPSLPGGGVKTSRKGVGEFEVTVHGKSAHAGIAPGDGANAVHELAHQIVALQMLQDLERGRSVNATVVSGGERVNVIPPFARARVDVRVTTMADAEEIQAALHALAPRLPGTRVEVRGGVGRPPMERSEGAIRLYETARACARAMGKELQEGATGGASDGNFTAAVGVPTLDGLGPEGDGAHALHEHVLTADLPWRAAFLARLLSRLTDGPSNRG